MLDETPSVPVSATYDYYYYKMNPVDQCEDYDAFKESRLVKLFDNIEFTEVKVVFQFEEFLTGKLTLTPLTPLTTSTHPRTSDTSNTF